jgi:hypothetical protein
MTMQSTTGAAAERDVSAIRWPECHAPENIAFEAGVKMAWTVLLIHGMHIV